MSLINNMLRDLQNRRNAGMTKSAPAGIRPVAIRSRKFKSRTMLGILAGLGLFAIAGVIGWQEWRERTETEHSMVSMQSSNASSSMTAPGGAVRHAATRTTITEAPQSDPAPTDRSPVQNRTEKQSPPTPISHDQGPFPGDPTTPVAASSENPSEQQLPSSRPKPRTASVPASEQQLRNSRPMNLKPTLAMTDHAPSGSTSQISSAPLDQNATSKPSPLQPVENGFDPEESSSGARAPFSNETAVSDDQLQTSGPLPGWWEENPDPPMSFGPGNGRFSRTTPAATNSDSALRRGLSALERGNLREAEEWLRRGLHVDPAHGPSLEALMTILLRQSRDQEVMALLSTAKHDLSPRLRLVKARLLAGMGEQDQALLILDRMAEKERTPEFFALHGAILQQLGRFEPAARAYGAALRGGLHTGTNWAGLGMALEGMGRLEDAREAYRQSMALGLQDAPLAKYVADRFNALR